MITPEENGALAHELGLSIADSPYRPGDPAGAQWRAQWIAAETRARGAAGTLGATDDDYRRAGLKPPLRTCSARFAPPSKKELEELDRIVRGITPPDRLEARLAVPELPLRRALPRRPPIGATMKPPERPRRPPKDVPPPRSPSPSRRRRTP